MHAPAPTSTAASTTFPSPDPDSTSRPGLRAPAWLQSTVLGLETATWPDKIADVLRPAARKVGDGPQGEVLRGQWLGHALHPLLTDLPLGCWLGSGLLDMLGGRGARGASRKLVGLGVLSAVPTAASGMADWSTVTEPGVRRVGAVHAAGNAAMLGVYLMSWRARRRGHHWRGVGLGLIGGGLGWATGYLGGHLSFNLGTGTGDRGLREETSPANGDGHSPA
jgi:hypothetical protein